MSYKTLIESYKSSADNEIHWSTLVNENYTWQKFAKTNQVPTQKINKITKNKSKNQISENYNSESGFGDKEKIFLYAPERRTLLSPFGFTSGDPAGCGNFMNKIDFCGHPCEGIPEGRQYGRKYGGLGDIYDALNEKYPQTEEDNRNMGGGWSDRSNFIGKGQAIENYLNNVLEENSTIKESYMFGVCGFGPLDVFEIIDILWLSYMARRFNKDRTNEKIEYELNKLLVYKFIDFAISLAIACELERLLFPDPKTKKLAGKAVAESLAEPKTFAKTLAKMLSKINVSDKVAKGITVAGTKILRVGVKKTLIRVVAGTKQALIKIIRDIKDGDSFLSGPLEYIGDYYGIYMNFQQAIDDINGINADNPDYNYFNDSYFKKYDCPASSSNYDPTSTLLEAECQSHGYSSCKAMKRANEKGKKEIKEMVDEWKCNLEGYTSCWEKAELERSLDNRKRAWKIFKERGMYEHPGWPERGLPAKKKDFFEELRQTLEKRKELEWIKDRMEQILKIDGPKHKLMSRSEYDLTNMSNEKIVDLLNDFPIESDNTIIHRPEPQNVKSELFSLTNNASNVFYKSGTHWLPWNLLPLSLHLIDSTRVYVEDFSYTHDDNRVKAYVSGIAWWRTDTPLPVAAAPLTSADAAAGGGPQDYDNVLGYTHNLSMENRISDDIIQKNCYVRLQQGKYADDYEQIDSDIYDKIGSVLEQLNIDFEKDEKQNFDKEEALMNDQINKIREDDKRAQHNATRDALLNAGKNLAKSLQF